MKIYQCINTAEPLAIEREGEMRTMSSIANNDNDCLSVAARDF